MRQLRNPRGQILTRHYASKLSNPGIGRNQKVQTQGMQLSGRSSQICGRSRLCSQGECCHN